MKKEKTIKGFAKFKEEKLIELKKMYRQNEDIGMSLTTEEANLISKWLDTLFTEYKVEIDITENEIIYPSLDQSFLKDKLIKHMEEIVLEKIGFFKPIEVKSMDSKKLSLKTYLPSYYK